VRLGDAVLTAGDAVILSIPPAFDAAADPSFAATFTDAAPVDAADARPFTTSLTVRRGARAVGRTPAAAGLTGVPGVVLFAVGRGGEMLTPPPPDLVLQAKDTLWFAGDAASVPFLRRVPGLAHSADGQAAKLPTHPVHRRLVQACVSAHSPLAGRTLRDVRFRDQYGAAVVAVHRAGAAPPAADVASIPLRAGDVLVLEAGPAFAAAAASRRAFSIISDLPHSAPPRRGARWVAAGIVLAMISAQVATAAVGGAVEERADLFLLASLAAAAMLATRCLSFANARASIEWDVYVTVAFAFGLATALEKSGVGAAVAAGFEAALHHGGVVASPTAVLTLIYFATCVLSEVVSNDAAAALMFPVAASLAEAFAIPPRRAAVALALGGSAGWVLPFSYQCNLIVLAAGNYTTREFATAGAPMYAWMTPFVAFAFHFADAWWIPLAVSAAAFALSPGVPLAAGAIGRIVAAAREGRAKRREGKEEGRRG
jgi:di/tricarboxylate transporter